MISHFSLSLSCALSRALSLFSFKCRRYPQKILYIEIPDRGTPKAKCVNTFTCPLFKLSWVLDAVVLRTLRTRYKSARFPPRVLHRSSLSSDTSHIHVLSLKRLADTSERARGHIHTQTLSLSLSRYNIHCVHRRRGTSSPAWTSTVVPRSATALPFAVDLSHAQSTMSRT